MSANKEFKCSYCFEISSLEQSKKDIIAATNCKCALPEPSVKGFVKAAFCGKCRIACKLEEQCPKCCLFMEIGGNGSFCDACREKSSPVLENGLMFRMQARRRECVEIRNKVHGISMETMYQNSIWYVKETPLEEESSTPQSP